MKLILGMFFVGCVLSLLGPESSGDSVMAIAWWIPMAMGAAKGVAQGQQNKRRMKQHDEFRKKSIEMSPWSGMQDPGALALPSMAGSMLTGAAQGAMLGKMMPKSAFSAPDTLTPTTQSPLGGSQMSAQLGQQGAGTMQAAQSALGGASPWGSLAQQGSAGALGSIAPQSMLGAGDEQMLQAYGLMGQKKKANPYSLGMDTFTAGI